MTKRITITIPKELHDRLQAVKSDLNVSRECQKALNLVVQVEEIRRSDLPPMEKVIARLKIEKTCPALFSNKKWKRQ